jgi:hypothetical protein
MTNRRSDDIARMLPMELALLGHPRLNTLWHAKRAERTLMTYQLQGVLSEHTPQEREFIEQQQEQNKKPKKGHGPIIVCLDTSGSMQGEAEQVAKALVLEALCIAFAEDRRCFVYSFSGPQQLLQHELDLTTGGLGRLLQLFLQSLFIANQQNDAIHPNAGYFASFSEEHIGNNVNKIADALEWLGREYILIEAKNCTFKNMAKQLYGESPKRMHDAWVMFEETLLGSDKVLIISNISQSKIPTRKSWHARSIMKINDDAHFSGVKPRSEILFIDYACFLQRSWPELGTYLEVFT